MPSSERRKKTKDDTWGAEELGKSIKDAMRDDSASKRRSHDKDKNKDRERRKDRESKDKDREHRKDRDKDREHRKDRDKDKDREHRKDRDREKDREHRKDKEHRDKDKDREHRKDRDREKDKDSLSAKVDEIEKKMMEEREALTDATKAVDDISKSSMEQYEAFEEELQSEMLQSLCDLAESQYLRHHKQHQMWVSMISELDPMVNIDPLPNTPEVRRSRRFTFQRDEYGREMEGQQEGFSETNRSASFQEPGSVEVPDPAPSTAERRRKAAAKRSKGNELIERVKGLVENDQEYIKLFIQQHFGSEKETFLQRNISRVWVGCLGRKKR